jgi:hypothetical protein
VVGYLVSWDAPSVDDPTRGHEVEVSEVVELDAVLDRIEAQAASQKVPFAVQIHNDAAAGSILLGIGHASRSFMDWLVPDGLHQYAYEATYAAGSETVGFDMYGGAWACDKILPSILPQGSRLTVWVTRDGGRTWWRGTYVGTGERIHDDRRDA